MDINKKLTSKKFLKVTLAVSLLFVASIIAINVSFDIYGLFRPVEGRKLKIFYNERISKYLLSYHYIPQNFNTLIIGTSLSANLDVTEYNNKPGNYKIYNASIMGGNITEIKPILENSIKGNVKNVIICISPYLTKNSGSKEVVFGPKLYYGALASKNLYDTYTIALIRHFNLMPTKFPKEAINEYGVNFFTDRYKVNNVKEKIQTVIKGLRGEQIKVDSVAVIEFKELVATLKQNNINVIAYFHPVPIEVFESKKSEYDNFHKMIKDIIHDDFPIIDFNTLEYRYFRSDYSNYIDHGHLSVKGQKQLTDMIFSYLGSTPSNLPSH